MTNSRKKEPQTPDLLKHSPFIRKLLSKYPVSRLFMLSFLFLIAAGTLLLSLPVSNLTDDVSILDHLFTSVSAVCVTGLVPGSVISRYTTFGQVVLLFLMQTGGIGLITFAALFLIMWKKSVSMYESIAIADISGTPGSADASVFLIKIFKYTFLFEGIGFILLASRFCQDYGPAGLFKALFVSVAAFTNAGFDNISESSLVPYASDPLVSITVMFLIITGGIGFMVWYDLSVSFKKILRIFFIRKEKRHPLARFVRILNFHTKMVLSSTLVLIVSGAIVYYLSELGSTVNPLHPGKALLVSLFQSVTLRTAGFATVDIASCRRITLLVLCGYMLIGGSPGGTAGGLKTTTAAVIFVEFRNLFFKRKNFTIFSRRIRLESFRNAFLLLGLYLILLFAGALVLSVTEDPSVDFIRIIFEEFSAVATVGLTAGITPLLSLPGKVVIMLLMYAGRIGPLMLMDIIWRKTDKQTEKLQGHVEYPSVDIIIG